MDQGQPPRGLLCPACGANLQPHGDLAGEEGDRAAPLGHRMFCPTCGDSFRARRRGPSGVEEPSPFTPASAGTLELFWRGTALFAVEWTYRFGVLAGSILLLLCGGFAPVLSAWLRDEIKDRAGILEALGGVDVAIETRDPDADLGPVLAFTDAPLLFSAVNEVSRRLGVKPPGQVRLTYLPCCGVVAWGRSRALILGLPLLRVLTLSELRAVLAHELAHLARGDATRAARSARFVEGMRQALDKSAGRERGPLGAWARLACRVASRLIGPIARGQEARADRSAAAIAGGSAAASALVKVALVQPVFREVLEHYDASDPEAPNLYAFFRTFWYRLPAEVHTAMRLRILAGSDLDDALDPTHPPLPDRLAMLQTYPDPAASALNADSTPATAYFGDLEGFEQMLHNRLFALSPVEPSIFHKAGT